MRLPTPAIALLALVPLTLVPLGACAGPGGAPARETEPRIVDTTGESPNVIRIENESSVTTRFLDAPMPRVWEALQHVYQELELPVSVLEPAKGLIGNSGFRARRIEGRRMSRYLDCGQGMTGPNADRFDIVLSLYTTVVRQGDGTELVIDVDAAGRPRDVAGNTIHCVSEGRLEALITERLEARLEGSPPPPPA